jgi:Amt family ammonium transporter
VDFARGGAVHLLGGIIALILCLFAKFAARKVKATAQPDVSTKRKKGFFEWMYPISGGSEGNIEKAALGVLILWFGWFAFNCGSTESIFGGHEGYDHSVPGRIAVNMIICCAAGGTLAVIIASWAQVKYRAATVNANEIANNVLSCLVAISSSCPILQYWQASLVGILAVVFYHVGCFIEYKLRIPDTARVFPVHAVCGLLGMLVIPFVLWIPPGKCLLHATYESVLWCSLELPNLGVGELLLGQVLAVLLIIGVALCIVPLYLVLYYIPVRRLGGVLAT